VCVFNDMLYFCSSHSAVCSSCIVVFAALGIFVFVNSPADVRLLLIIKLFFVISLLEEPILVAREFFLCMLFFF
jgi:hypothetical protein